ncbi:hypothetical protein LGL08_12585 [Clostridium estertheticum]|uniref:hypothetical protein n=1 Tax=Clostridium estertheticum TaxID=238834 RepID=UPI001CF46F78|nr:hypothetical protein [Clostridium estertheticum]MCB2306874.1 hypothetical protein [Clostridium estertheticum]MCB2350380.1 hypothetical protein [Clostridium estertheticum]
MCPHIGYKKASEIAKAALKTKQSVRELILKEGLLGEKGLNDILDIELMTKPGILAKELMVG